MMVSLKAVLQDWMDPADPAKRMLRLEQLSLAAQNTDASLRQLPVVSAGIVGVLAFWVPIWPLVGWWVAVALASLAMCLFLRPYIRKQIDVADLRRASIRFFWVDLFTSAVIAAIAPVAWMPGEPLVQCLILLIICAGMASVSSITAPSRLIFAADMIAFAGASILTPVIVSGVEGAASGVLAVLFAVLMIDNAKGAYRLAESALTLNDENKALIERLRASDRAKSEYLANMSHELRTPLNAILGFSEVMKDEMMGPMQNRTYRAYAADIHGSGQHLLGLVNDVLDLAKIEAGRMDLDDDVFSLNDVTAQAGALFRLQAETAGVSLIRDIRETITVRWDHRSAKQIAINLLSNALKFTPRGGSVKTSISMRPDGSAAIAIRDTGCGIAPEYHETIFEAFGQAKGNSQQARQGTGLGLAIVRGLVEMQGGRIELLSAPGEGTTVTIIIPPERVVAVERRQLAAA